MFFVRHAEKDTNSDPQDPALTRAGQARASCLADLLAAAEVTHVFHSGLTRTATTVAPLASRRGLTPVVIPARDGEAQLRALRALPTDAVALVAGHSNTIPAMISALGGTVDELNAHGYLEDSAYNRLFEVVLDSSGDALRVVEFRYCQPSVRADE